MKHLYKIVLSTLFLCSSLSATAADEWQYLNIVGRSETKSFNLSDLKKLTFKDGCMQIYTTSLSESMVLTDLDYMVFSLTTGFSATLADGVRMTYNANSESLLVEGATGITLQVFQLSGNLIKKIKIGSTSETISLADLTEGIYLVRVGTQVIKINK